MKLVHLAPMTAIAILSMTPACGSQEDLEQNTLDRTAQEPQEQKSAGYGFEFIDDSLNQGGVGVSSAAPALPPGGRLAPEAIRDVVRAGRDPIRACYKAALGKDPGTEGRIAVRFVIQNDGSVSKAERETSTITDAAMVGCVVDAFKTLSFPVSSGGEATVIYPVLFSPRDMT